MSSVRRDPFVRNTPNTVSLASFDQSMVASFHRNLPGYKQTPLVPLPDIAQEFGVKAVFIKDESNRFGLPSFKILGASWGTFAAVAARLGVSLDCGIDTLASEARKAGIVLYAATDGNHGRAVAFMARLLSIEARIYVSCTLDEQARQAIISEGAQVIAVSDDYDGAVMCAAEAAVAARGGVLVQDTSFPEYEDTPARIVDGYSTVLTETDDQLAELGLASDVIFSPVGVGSLAHAVLRHAKAHGRTKLTKVVAVEPDTAACLYKNLRSATCGPSAKIRTSHTIMTGLDCGTVSYTAWPDLRSHVDASVTVSDFETHCAVQDLQSRGLASGPCGAAGLAALRCLTVENRARLGFDENTVIVLLNTEGSRLYRTPHNVSTDDAVELAQILTRIESTNTTLSQSKGSGEAAIADYIEAWLEHRGIASYRHELEAGRPSIVGVVHGTGTGQSLMLNGHIDTVSLAAYEKDPLSGDLVQKDGQLAVTGRGSLDMKAGVAAAMAALVTAKKKALNGSVILAAVADEEDASHGTMEILAAGWRTDGAVIPEPTMLQLGTGHKGFVWVEVEILGVASHGSQPDIGVDSIANAGLFLHAFKGYTRSLPTDEFLGKASAHCGLIEGGEELSSYPASCKIKLEFRTVPGQHTEDIIRDLTTVLHGLAKECPEFKYKEPKVLLQRPAYKLPSEHSFSRAAASAAGCAMGHLVESQGLAFWCDAALLDQAGIPTVVFGPRGEGLHGKEEWVDIESIRITSSMLDNLIADFCK